MASCPTVATLRDIARASVRLCPGVTSPSPLVHTDDIDLLPDEPTSIRLDRLARHPWDVAK